MAIKKKAGEVKAVAPKKSATPVKTVAKNKLKEKEITIKVPQGGQVIRSFNLTPALPVDGQAGNWLLIDPTDKKPSDISLIHVSFSVESTTVEQEFERAILLINLQQNPDENGRWRFVMNGVTADPEYSDVDHDVGVIITNEGQTLIAHVQVIGDSQEEIKFGYVASFTDAESGAVSIYESKDPGFVPGRP